MIFSDLNVYTSKGELTEYNARPFEVGLNRKNQPANDKMIWFYTIT